MLKEYIGKLGKNSMIYGVGNMMTKMLALIFLPFLTAYLTPEDYGIINMFATFAMFVQPLFQMGISAGLAPIYFSKKNECEQNEIISHAFLVLLFSSGLLGVASYLFQEMLSKKILGIEGYGKVFFLYMISISISSLEIPFLSKYQFDEKAFKYVIITVITSFVNYGLLYLFVIQWKKGLDGYIYGVLISEFVRFILYCLGIGLSAYRFIPKAGIVIQLLRYSLPFVPSFFSLYILQQIGRIILKQENGLGEAGIYSAGINLGSVMTVLVGGLTTAWTPFFLSFKERNHKTAKILGNIIRLYIYIVGTVVILFFLFSKPVVLLLMDSLYSRAYQVVGFYACAQYFSGFFSMLLPPIYYAGETRYISVFQCIAASISVFITITLTRQYGIIGAGIAMAVSYFVLVILLIFWNCYKKDYLKIELEWKMCFKFLLFLVMSILLILVLQKRNIGLLNEWIQAVLIAVIWASGIGFYLIKFQKLNKFFQD